MKITIRRGGDQVGGSIIEISSGNTRILLDAGRELDEGASPALPNVDGLFDKRGYDAVIFSHNHTYKRTRGRGGNQRADRATCTKKNYAVSHRKRCVV